MTGVKGTELHFQFRKENKLGNGRNSGKSMAPRKRNRIIELTYLLLLWIPGGGLVILATYACYCLLKYGQRLEDAEDEKLWQYLLNPGRPETGS
jgi:hypothetical protein